MEIITKTCNKCGVIGELELFKKDQHSTFGRRNTCKSCAVSISSATRLKKHDQYLQKAKEWREQNLALHVRLTKEWRCKNKEKFAASVKAWNSRPLQKIANSVRARAVAGIKAAILNKHYKTIDMLGIDFISYSEYLAKKFVGVMTLENYGTVWHIDHIIPLASAKNEQELMQLLHYTNTQPLFAKDNLSKGAKLDWRN
jgi:hypothetical protein